MIFRCWVVINEVADYVKLYYSCDDDVFDYVAVRLWILSHFGSREIFALFVQHGHYNLTHISTLTQTHTYMVSCMIYQVSIFSFMRIFEKLIKL